MAGSGEPHDRQRGGIRCCCSSKGKHVLGIDPKAPADRVQAVDPLGGNDLVSERRVDDAAKHHGQQVQIVLVRSVFVDMLCLCQVHLEWTPFIEAECDILP
jgi:hypothetical protein